jgi:hypothetical protein
MRRLRGCRRSDSRRARSRSLGIKEGGGRRNDGHDTPPRHCAKDGDSVSVLYDGRRKHPKLRDTGAVLGQLAKTKTKTKTTSGLPFLISLPRRSREYYSSGRADRPPASWRFSARNVKALSDLQL